MEHKARPPARFSSIRSSESSQIHPHDYLKPRLNQPRRENSRLAPVVVQGRGRARVSASRERIGPETSPASVTRRRIVTSFDPD